MTKREYKYHCYQRKFNKSLVQIPFVINVTPDAPKWVLNINALKSIEGHVQRLKEKRKK